jgi:hypothetical protein
MLNDADFNASSTKDYMDESFVDEMYYSSFVYIDSIKAKAIGGKNGPLNEALFFHIYNKIVT